MSIDYSSLMAQLKMGVDIMPDTDPDMVPHTRVPGYLPRYSLEVLVDPEDESAWTPMVGEVSPEELPSVVDRMHWAFDVPVRLMEDGYQIFACDS